MHVCIYARIYPCATDKEPDIEEMDEHQLAEMLIKEQRMRHMGLSRFAQQALREDRYVPKHAYVYLYQHTCVRFNAYGYLYLFVYIYKCVDMPTYRHTFMFIRMLRSGLNELHVLCAYVCCVYTNVDSSIVLCMRGSVIDVLIPASMCTHVYLSCVTSNSSHHISCVHVCYIASHSESETDEANANKAGSGDGTGDIEHDDEAAAEERMLKQWNKRAKMRRIMAEVQARLCVYVCLLCIKLHVSHNLAD